MALVVGIRSEVTQPGLFDFVGISMIGRMDEFPSGGGLTLGNVGTSRLVQTDQQVDFRFQWNVSGIFTHTINPAFLWQIEIFLEQYGPDEFSLGATGRKSLAFGTGTPALGNTISFPGVAGSTTISIPPNAIPEGVYDVVAVIRLTHPAPTFTPCFLAAFAEYGKIQFYQEH